MLLQICFIFTARGLPRAKENYDEDVSHYPMSNRCRNRVEFH